MDMDISGLRIGHRGMIKGRIIEKGAIREFGKFGKTGRVCECFLEDGTGKIKLVLWDEQIDEFKENEVIEIAGYVKEYKGEIQFNVLERKSF